MPINIKLTPVKKKKTAKFGKGVRIKEPPKKYFKYSIKIKIIEERNIETKPNNPK